MGYAYIFWVYEDALHGIRPESPNWAKMREELGEAVLRLTRDVRYYAGSGPKRRTSHRLGHMGEGVNYCDEVHYSDQRVFLWSDSRLYPLSKAHDDVLHFDKEEVEKHLGGRRSGLPNK